MRGASRLEWLVVLATFLIANAVEYTAHRWPMHRPLGPLREMYARHTLQHHAFFTHDAMTVESSRDYWAVMFPPAAIFLFLGVIGGPVAALFFLLASRNAGWIYLATAVSYFLSYEWLHLAYHLPPDGVWGRLPFMALLRRHHTVHHDPRLMADWNFNITVPLMDTLVGTRRSTLKAR